MLKSASLLIMALLMSNSSLAREAPGALTSFNVECPAPKACAKTDKLFKKCSKNKKNENACESFAGQIQTLLPEYDCQRAVDGKSIPKYIVPAIWLCGDKKAEKYMRLMGRLKGEKAQEVLSSEAFRNALTTSVAKHDSRLKRIKNREPAAQSRKAVK
jgi:hypothetical protein